ncbi:SipW-dependent-type signal peptide-containing protein [Leifsonia poae]|uniref:SipW-dependent-type signal peptide-containing protein n=1 Tax=Leifsonia poae TaxID=110933 RepID=UPI001CBCDF8D|nr:SipW-dependent-type signal peptide-containing protein [Leifsonia poae]
MSQVRPHRSRSVRALRLRAVLAGGLVLGVGATVTLASWTDNEFATGTFSSSVFDTQSSVNGAAYADNATAPGATFTLAGPFAPGVSSYFPVLIRTKANSVAGTVVLNGATLGGTDAATLGAALVYRVVLTTGTCSAAAFTGSPSFVVGAAGVTRALTAGQESGVNTALAAATGAAPGAATGYCFEVTLPASAPNSLQGKTATATWQFAATSS